MLSRLRSNKRLFDKLFLLKKGSLYHSFQFEKLRQTHVEKITRLKEGNIAECLLLLRNLDNMRCPGHPC